MTVLKNRVGVLTSTSGTGTITLGTPIGGGVAINTVGWQSFAGAGVANGDTVRYLIFDSNGTWEYGPGVYSTTGPTLIRAAGAMDGTVEGQRSSGGSLLSLTGTAQVFITAVAEDILIPETAAATYAPLISPTFIGTPAAPTASVGTNTTQIATTAFVLANAFPSGTLMLFQQTAAPTGWTKQTTHNDKTLRVVSGTASSGGSSAFSTVFGKTATDAHTLTVAEMPSHSHSLTPSVRNLTPDQNTGDQTATGPAVWGEVQLAVVATGGGGSHTHPMDIQVQYVDLIIASKN